MFHLDIDMGSCTYYVITDRGGSLQIITVLHRVGPANDYVTPGLHKLWYPGIRDRSTWGMFGAHGEHGDVFLFSNLGAL